MCFGLLMAGKHTLVLLCWRFIVPDFIYSTNLYMYRVFPGLKRPILASELCLNSGDPDVVYINKVTLPVN